MIETAKKNDGVLQPVNPGGDGKLQNGMCPNFDDILLSYILVNWENKG